MARIVDLRCVLAVRDLKASTRSFDGVDEFYREIAARGAMVTSPTDKPWGLREFALRTPDGHRITCGELLRHA